MFQINCMASHNISMGSPVQYDKNMSRRKIPYVKMLGNKSNKYRYGIALNDAKKGEQVIVGIY